MKNPLRSIPLLLAIAAASVAIVPALRPWSAPVGRIAFHASQVFIAVACLRISASLGMLVLATVLAEMGERNFMPWPRSDSLAEGSIWANAIQPVVVVVGFALSGDANLVVGWASFFAVDFVSDRGSKWAHRRYDRITAD